jgi:hypothetical protein
VGLICGGRAGTRQRMDDFSAGTDFKKCVCVSSHMTGALSSRDQSAIAIFFTVRTRALVHEKGISYKYEFLRRQYHAGSLNFLRGTVFAIARATW